MTTVTPSTSAAVIPAGSGIVAATRGFSGSFRSTTVTDDVGHGPEPATPSVATIAVRPTTATSPNVPGWSSTEWPTCFRLASTWAAPAHGVAVATISVSAAAHHPLDVIANPPPHAPALTVPGGRVASDAGLVRTQGGTDG